ncbi:MAG: MMPL family transporter [Deltaproteobacteria bacterium]|nr:MMPL family transporter [Deltaproteobacteria bacterium]
MEGTPEARPPFNPFRWLAALGASRPWLVLVVTALLAVASGAAIHGIRISTSRYHLVSEENEHQQRLLVFFERFGIQDALALVLEGGTPEERRRVQRDICFKLEREPEFAGRTLCRIGPSELAEVAMLWEPKAIEEGLLQAGGGKLAPLVEGGVPAWIGAVEKGLTSALDGGAGKSADPEQIKRGPAMLAKALRALDAQLTGKDGLAGLDVGNAAKQGGPSGATKVDEAGYLVGNGGASHMIVLFPALPGSEGYELAPIVRKVRKLYGEVDLGPVRPALTGMPAIASDELDAVDAGLEVSTIGTGLGLILLLLIGYRSFRYSLMALVPLGLGTLLTVATARVLFRGLNIVTSSFVSVLMGIGINYALYALARYSEELRDGVPQPRALELAYEKTGTGMVISAATTILAFATVMITDFTAYRQLGLLVGIGIVIMVLLTVVVCPALARVLDPKGERQAADRFVGLDRLEPLIRTGKWPLLGLAAALSVFGGLYAGRLQFNARYFDFLPTNAESVRGLTAIESDKGASPVLANLWARDVEAARALTERVRKLPLVGNVDSATDLLPPLTPERLAALERTVAALGPRPDFAKLRGRERSAKKVSEKVSKLADAFDEVAFAMRRAELPTEGIEDAKKACGELKATLAKLPDDGREALGTIETSAADILERAWTTAENVSRRKGYTASDLPSVFRARYAGKDGQAMAVYAQPARDIWDEASAAAFAKELRSAAPEASGFALDVDAYQMDIKRSFTLACFLTAALAVVTCLLGFRNLKDSVLAMLPVAVGLAAMMAFMAAFGIHVNVANIVAFPLSLGMGVEAGAHIMSRCRQSESSRGGVALLGDMIEGTGTAVMLASTTTIVGFGALTLADYRAMKSLGVIMCVGMTTNLLAALVFLPALLLALGRAK